MDAGLVERTVNQHLVEKIIEYMRGHELIHALYLKYYILLL
jgi:hypothetical protein